MKNFADFEGSTDYSDCDDLEREWNNDANSQLGGTHYFDGYGYNEDESVGLIDGKKDTKGVDETMLSNIAESESLKDEEFEKKMSVDGEVPTKVIKTPHIVKNKWKGCTDDEDGEMDSGLFREYV